MGSAQTNTETRPALWIGCLAAYNEGKLHGKWFYPADYTDGDDFWDSVKAYVIDKSPAAHPEELHICDAEGWGAWRPDSYTFDFDGYVELAEYIEEYEDRALAMLAYHTDQYGNSDGVPDVDTLSDYENFYEGEWDSDLDRARELGREFLEQHLATLRSVTYPDLGPTAEFFERWFDEDGYAKELVDAFIEVRVGSTMHIFRKE